MFEESDQQRIDEIKARLGAITQGRLYLEQNPYFPSRQDIHVVADVEGVNTLDWKVVAEGLRGRDAGFYLNAPDDVRFLLELLEKREKQPDKRVMTEQEWESLE